ncbi:hypothetical protein [Oscillatoria acuminata]|uniref:Uncharacterized protein n=1 Tax=Oscillatoria acuminata PCC 6304 TaxID=56110 RepID=K9TE19_9CYAN|nr:hypothetical protein [Oscillatoria acuminata]AFY81127.1 hypothetical protein Oscil6304_1420 [Oscillatoria acuminata PCC 6304]
MENIAFLKRLRFGFGGKAAFLKRNLGRAVGSQETEKRPTQFQVKEAIRQWGEPFRAYLALFQDPKSAINSFENSYAGEYADPHDFERHYPEGLPGCCFIKSPHGVYAFRNFFQGK